MSNGGLEAEREMGRAERRATVDPRLASAPVARGFPPAVHLAAVPHERGKWFVFNSFTSGFRPFITRIEMFIKY